ncbi:MAG: DUF1134 domain-containing protein [Sphingomonadales bacterium]|nr:DUF1134 domain-containing protein [Sphingomonadales bacterium]MBD3774140.1 DUF1134 domain-containing protein [Paracoccaceae bacterium]
MTRIFSQLGRGAFAALAGLAMTAAALPAAAQEIQKIDPDTAIDGDLQEQPGDAPVYGTPAPSGEVTTDANAGVAGWSSADTQQQADGDVVMVAPSWNDPSQAASEASADPAGAAVQGGTYKKDDLIGAAEGVFGKGAEGLARMIEGLLSKQGEPNAYIVGREASGAFVFGARYGSGTLYHKVEGERPVYWTGPSVGFDAGANAANTFILVYNLYDSQELYKRFPQGEGQIYVVGGLTASYMRKGDIVLIPIRMGAGLRLGINAGYMKFSEKQRWLPF